MRRWNLAHINTFRSIRSIVSYFGSISHSNLPDLCSCSIHPIHPIHTLTRSTQSMSPLTDPSDPSRSIQGRDLFWAINENCLRDTASLMTLLEKVRKASVYPLPHIVGHHRVHADSVDSCRVLSYLSLPTPWAWARQNLTRC
jgi:hypothetical protein